MSFGKYSPRYKKMEIGFNCYGETPAPYDKENYDEKTMFADYDCEGFDPYGYSCFDLEGNYIGIGLGIDRLGYTEMEHLDNSISELDYCENIHYEDTLSTFIRKKDGDDENLIKKLKEIGEEFNS